MPDREKVMTWLEICGKNRDCSGNCPYGDGSGEYEDRLCREDLMADAFALLKEQEAVEPNVSSTEQRCGNCNKVIEMDGWKSCPWCGKPIAWSEWWSKNADRM